MDEQVTGAGQALVLDGNAVAGVLQEIFGLEMTDNLGECANCGQVSALGGLMAYTQAPGAVLRCPACQEVVMTIVQSPEAIYLDARGAAYLKLKRLP